jgi:hypothetical protein
MDFMRHIVADVNVTLVANGPHHIHTLIHPATEAVDISRIGLSVLAHERDALVSHRRLHAGNGKNRRREVNESYHKTIEDILATPNRFRRSLCVTGLSMDFSSHRTATWS